MKLGTGKTRSARKPKKSPKKAALQPLDIQQRYTISEAAAYLRQSIPKTYQQIHAGRLETIKEGRRRYATGRGIAALSLPPVAAVTV